MQAEQTKKPREFTGWHFLIIIVTFFAVIISVNVFMAWSAVSTWTGLVVKNTYDASQEYNGKLAVTRNQIAMGWKGNVIFSDKTVIFTFLDGNGEPLETEDVAVNINRPVGMDGEIKMSMNRLEDGSYSVPADLASGQWNVFVRATFADQPAFDHYARLIIE